MKKIMTIMVVLCFFISVPFAIGAGWKVTAIWTPSPDAHSEILVVGGEQQECPQAGSCTFIVAELTGQRVIVRSLNSQGRGVEYEMSPLIEASLPNPASNGYWIISIAD